MTHQPEVVESFPAPDEIIDANTSIELLSLPSLSRLAIAFDFMMSVWDVRGSKLLLKTDWGHSPLMFSSDGHLFVSDELGKVHVWKESPAGYILHQQIATIGSSVRVNLSPNGGSILIFTESKINLRHTKDPILPAQMIDDHDFVLAFSPDEPSVAFARQYAATVTILDLQSGDPKLAIDTNGTVSGLGVTGSAILVYGRRAIRTWRLTAGDNRAGFTGDVIQAATLGGPSPFHFRIDAPIFWSVSPDLSRVIVSGYGNGNLSRSAGLEIYCTSTGRSLTGVESSTGVLKLMSLWMYSGPLTKLEVEMWIC